MPQKACGTSVSVAVLVRVLLGCVLMVLRGFVVMMGDVMLVHIPISLVDADPRNGGYNPRLRK